jgi:hypothetical protein
MIHRHVSRRHAAAIKAVDAGTASFDDWFTAQFGPAPAEMPAEELNRKLHDAHQEVARLQILDQAARQYSSLRDAALKAWAARETQLRRRLLGK